jgi:hypothetical protein
MNRFDDPVADPEAATDQLVDEICQRLAALYSLVNLSFAEAGPPVEDIRMYAAEIVRRLARPDGRAVAISTSRTLWPHPASGAVPPDWWRTPLGALMSQSLDVRRLDAVSP